MKAFLDYISEVTNKEPITIKFMCMGDMIKITLIENFGFHLFKHRNYILQRTCIKIKVSDIIWKLLEDKIFKLNIYNWRFV